MKRLLAFVVALCMSIMVMPGVAFAAETQNVSGETEKNYLNYDFPENAIILYQSEDVVIY